MRFFEVLDFQHMVLAIFLGLIAALVIYMSFRGDPTAGRTVTWRSRMKGNRAFQRSSRPGAIRYRQY